MSLSRSILGRTLSLSAWFFFWRKTAKIKSDVSLVRAYFWYRALASSAKGLLISDNSLAVLVPHFGVEGVMIAIRPQVAAKMTVTQIMFF